MLKMYSIQLKFESEKQSFWENEMCIAWISIFITFLNII